MEFNSQMQNGYGNQAKTYLKQQVETASPERILIMLFEGSIRFLRIARKAMEEGDLEKSNKYLLKTQAILTELMSSLDMESGEELAQNLFRLYEYYHYRLVQANIQKDVGMIDEVLDHLRKFKDTWEEAIQIAKTEEASQISGDDLLDLDNEHRERSYSA